MGLALGVGLLSRVAMTGRAGPALPPIAATTHEHGVTPAAPSAIVEVVTNDPGIAGRVAAGAGRADPAWFIDDDALLAVVNADERRFALVRVGDRATLRPLPVWR